MSGTKLDSPGFQEVADPIERELLQDPTHNAGELYDIYGKRIGRVLEADATVIERSEAEIFLEACGRQRLVARFLPHDDLRYHRFWGSSDGTAN